MDYSVNIYFRKYVVYFFGLVGVKIHWNVNRIIIAGVVIGMIFTGICLCYNVQRMYVYLHHRYYGINSVSMPAEFESDATAIKISYK